MAHGFPQDDWGNGRSWSQESKKNGNIGSRDLKCPRCISTYYRVTGKRKNPLKTNQMGEKGAIIIAGEGIEMFCSDLYGMTLFILIFELLIELK